MQSGQYGGVGSGMAGAGQGEIEETSVVATMMKELTAFKEKLKAEDEEMVYSPFAGIEKSTVLQEAAAAFNDPAVVKQSPRKCCLLITKLLFLLAQGETFRGNEATEVFFAVTKLFQSQDLNLRRLTYLFIKEVAESTDAQEIIIVTASLTKDMNSQVDLYRANSIRVLSKIIDAPMLGQIERYIKQAIVDRNCLVASSALVSGNQMVAESSAKRDIVRRWLNEVQEAIHARSEMVQYHALSLLYNMKAHDKLAVSKLVTQLTRSTPKSALAMCLLVRYTSRLLHDDLSATNARAAYEFLEGCLRHKNEMVIYEAARAICRLPGVAPRDINPAVTVLQLFLSSPKPTLRFAAVRTLGEVAISHPMSVTKCNDDLEGLISDSNRSIATLAITTLLKTGAESSVDRLMKQIASFMSEIADEFKIVVVEAIRALCLKYKSKHRVLLNFLSSVLREEGGFEFKKAIVDTILVLIEAIPETKETGLFHLCEFIEDCEFTHLSAEILHLLGEEGPNAKQPAKFIRFIYNRVILENAHVRAAAVSALGKFGARVPGLTPSIIILLQRCQKDDDDEVRDRATLILALLQRNSAPARSVLLDALPMKPETMSRSLIAYRERPAAGPVTIETLPIVEEREATDTERAQASLGLADGLGIDATTPSSVDPAATAASAAAASAEELYKIPEFAALGPLFKSCKAVELTESETEYLVRVVKHIFNEHVVLQFNVTNTLNDQLLTDVQVVLEEQDAELYTVETVIPAARVPYDVTKQTFVCLRRPVDEGYPPSDFTSELRFKVQDVDPATGAADEDDEGYDEVWNLDDLGISAADFMAKVGVNDFRTTWELVGDGAELLEKFQLTQFKTLREAASAVCDQLGMSACEGTAAVPADARQHTLLLSGIFIGGVKVLARTLLALANADGQQCIVLKIAVRSESEAVTQLVIDCIA